MTLLIPEKKEPLPAIIYIPGGKFQFINKDNNIQNRLRIAEYGYVVACIEYRSSPNNIFPTQIQDVKSAVRYLKANALKYGINKDKIAVWGESVGGYLSTFAGTTSGKRIFDKGDNLDFTSDIQAVLDLYGATNLTTIAADFCDEQQALHQSPVAYEALFQIGRAHV